jgi:hypothetical protein
LCFSRAFNPSEDCAKALFMGIFHIFFIGTAAGSLIILQGCKLVVLPAHDGTAKNAAELDNLLRKTAKIKRGPSS